ncbi:MAG TPA: hypothetical protein DDY13_00520 [Cytophagales bacterium]|jgi:peroxiredoxin|nr:hypothetical protein [Cytophagales bacterium]
MRIFLTLSLVALLWSCQEKKGPAFLITGTLPEHNEEYVMLMERVEGEWKHLDSVIIQNDTFSLKGVVNEPKEYWITVKGNDAYGRFIIENETYDIQKVTENGRPSLEVKGGTLNEELKEVQAYQKSTYDSLVAIIIDIQQNMDITAEEKEAQLEVQYEEMNKFTDAYENHLRQYVAENNASFLAPYLVRNELYYSWDASQLDSVLQVFDTTLNDNIYVQQIEERADKLRLVSIGNEAPDFSQENPEGEPVALSDFKGKYVLIDFWASWCGPCRRENPNVVATYADYKDKNFEILGVSLDENKDRWLKAIEQDKITWPQVSDLAGWKNSVAGLYAVKSIPHTVLVDPEGVIVAKNLRGDQLKEKLEELL